LQYFLSDKTPSSLLPDFGYATLRHQNNTPLFTKEKKSACWNVPYWLIYPQKETLFCFGIGALFVIFKF
jgi:hypothetical protein